MPWTQVRPIDPETDYVASVTHLRPKSRRSTPALFRGAGKATKQLKGADGVVGFTTWVRPMRREYWTITLWEDEASIAAFARSGDHGELMRRLSKDLEVAGSVRWVRAGRDGRPTWDEAVRRMEPAAPVS